MITSSQNPKIKEVIKLRKANQRKKSDLIIIEGEKEIGLALAAGVKIKELFVAPNIINSPLERGRGVFSSRTNVIDVTELSSEVFSKISFRENADGYLSLAKPRYLSLEKIKLSKSPLVVILESVEKPGNLGAILRTCDAAGADALIVIDQQTDIYNPNVIRSSLGTVFTKQVVVADFTDVQSWLKKNKIKSYAATPNTDQYFTEMDFRGATAIVIGTEHEGLSDKWLEAADCKIKIPMFGKIDSLNASVSAAVLLYEAVRQRMI